MKTNPTDLDVQGRLKKWPEATALSLELLEASLKKDFPDLSEEELRLKVIERLNAVRRLPTSEK